MVTGNMILQVEEELSHLQTTTVLKMYSVFVSNIRISVMAFIFYIKCITQKITYKHKSEAKHNHCANNFIGLYANDIGSPDEEFSFRSVVDNTPLRYSANLHDVDWTNIVDQILPNMNGHRKKIMLHASGRYSINPVLLLSKMAQDEQYISHTMIYPDYC